MDHEAAKSTTITTATTSNMSAQAPKPPTETMQTHPLQDVELNGNSKGYETNGNNEIGSNTVDAASKRKQSKNWVKFEDDDHDDHDDDDDVYGGNATKTNNNSATQQQQNKLSTLPPPPPPSVVSSNNARARSRSPNERQKAAMDRAESNAAAAAAAASTTTVTAPVQRLTVQADVAPAVLNTESTHVNLNASGRQQQQQQSQLQQQQQQHQQQLINQKITNTNNSSQLTHPHHNGMPTTSLSTSATATTSAKATSPLGLSAMQKSVTDAAGLKASTSSSVTIPIEAASVPQMRTIELSTGRIREGFANGDVIVTLLPANTKWPWITPAIFRPELVPEELMAQGLTLTVEDYVNAMETLVNDYRFTVYNICYKRILVCWILFAFTVLLALLFSGLQGVALFSLGVGWLFLNAAAIFLCMWVKLRLSRGLEKCLARVNKQLIRHKILLILDDRGRISCHKVNLCFLYFDAAPCVSYLNNFLEQTEQNGGEAIKAGWEAKLDIDFNDIVIQGNNPVRLSRKQEHGMQLFLRYGSRWGRDALRGLVDVSAFEPGRHCGQFQCPCQYIKEHIECKPRGYPCGLCGCIVYGSDPSFQYRY